MAIIEYETDEEPAEETVPGKEIEIDENIITFPFDEDTVRCIPLSKVVRIDFEQEEVDDGGFIFTQKI